MNNLMVLIIGMMLVTYIPRLLPFLIIHRMKLPKKVNSFLEVVPYAALGALIIPGVFSAIPEMPQAGLLGVGFAILYAWYKGGIVLPVFGSVIVTFIMISIL